QAQAVADDVFGVVCAAFDLCTLQQACHQLVVVGGQLQHCVQGDALGLQHCVQRVDLCAGARVAVQQEAGSHVVLVQAVFDHVVGDRIRYKVAIVDVLAGFDTQRGAALDVRAEDVAGGDRGDLQALGDLHGLGSFAGTRRSNDKQSTYRSSPS